MAILTQLYQNVLQTDRLGGSSNNPGQKDRHASQTDLGLNPRSAV